MCMYTIPVYMDECVSMRTHIHVYSDMYWDIYIYVCVYYLIIFIR